MIIFLREGIEKLQEITKSSTSFKKICEYYNYRSGGDAYKLLKMQVQRLKLWWSDWKSEIFIARSHLQLC